MQEYLLKLLGHYRRYIHEDSPALNGSAFAYPLLPPHYASSSSTMSPSSSGRPGPGGGDDNALKGHGMVFEHAAFMSFHRWEGGGATPVRQARGLAVQCEIWRYGVGAVLPNFGSVGSRLTLRRGVVGGGVGRQGLLDRKPMAIRIPFLPRCLPAEPCPPPPPHSAPSP